MVLCLAPGMMPASTPLACAELNELPGQKHTRKGLVLSASSAAFTSGYRWMPRDARLQEHQLLYASVDP